MRERASEILAQLSHPRWRGSVSDCGSNALKCVDDPVAELLTGANARGGALQSR